MLPLWSAETVAYTEQLLVADAAGRYNLSNRATRTILRHCLHTRSEGIPLAIDQNGKPRVADSTRAPDICPSSPHSGDVALCAVSRGREVDMGVEEVRPIPG